MIEEGIKCPACNSRCKLSFTIADKDRTTWIFCKCGSIFHQKEVKLDYYNEEWKEKYLKWKNIKERYDYLETVYFGIVKELTLGRRFLEIGFGAEYHIENLTKDGWKATGIDLVENDYITGDFDKHDFKKEKFDFILISGVIGGVKEPMKTLYKIRELLNDKGVLLISDADADMVYEKGMFKFGNWNPNERWLIFSETQMKKTLDMLNFNVVVSHKNKDERFMNWNTYNIIAQKKDE